MSRRRRETKIAPRHGNWASIPDWVLAHPLMRRSRTALHTYTAMFLVGSFDERRTSATWRDIAELTGLGKSTVYRDVAALAKHELILDEGEGTYYMPIDESTVRDGKSTTVDFESEASIVRDKASTGVDTLSTDVEKTSTTVERTLYTESQSLSERQSVDADNELTAFEVQAKELCAILQGHVVAHGFKPFTEGKQSLSAMERLLRIDERTFEQVKYILEWCQKDDFWLSNIRSPQKFRDKFDTLLGQALRGKRGVLAFMAAGDEGSSWD